VWESQWNWQVVLTLLLVHSVLWMSQWEPTDLAFSSCFLYNLKFQQTDFSACKLLHADFLVGSFFDPEDGDDMFPQNIS
jgi:hypothetical protein